MKYLDSSSNTYKEIYAKPSGGVVATVVDTLDSTSATNALSANQGKILNDNITSGWINPNETWTYSSVDNPTGVITISGDKTSKYSLGMRIKFTNSGNTIYGIITKISYSSPNTTLTFLHEINPSTSQALHLMQNSAITNNYYSMLKIPYGFPLEQTKWTITYINTTRQATETPADLTWKQAGTVQKTIPTGAWRLELKVLPCFTNNDGFNVGGYVTLSTMTNSVGSSRLTSMAYLSYDTTNALQTYNTVILEDNVALSTPTTFYLLIMPHNRHVTECIALGDYDATQIIAECAYL